MIFSPVVKRHVPHGGFTAESTATGEEGTPVLMTHGMNDEIVAVSRGQCLSLATRPTWLCRWTERSQLSNGAVSTWKHWKTRHGLALRSRRAHASLFGATAGMLPYVMALLVLLFEVHPCFYHILCYDYKVKCV